MSDKPIVSEKEAHDLGINRWEAPSVGYVSEQDALWSKMLSAVTSLDELQRLGAGWRAYCADAVGQISKMNADDFDDFQAALRKERRGTFCGEAAMNKFGCIIMPEFLMKVSMVADQFKVPWGLAFIRLKEVGRVAKSNGAYALKDGKP